MNAHSEQDELITIQNVNVNEDYEPDEDEFDDEDDALISIANVDLNYIGKSGPIEALRNVTFNIFRGEFICVLGPSGCGKSTLLKILAGFIRPSSGSVKLSGEEITGTDWHRGVVFQHPPLYAWFTVRENVAFGPKMRKIPKEEYEKLTDEYLDKVQLREFADKRIYELSGGMKQRVSIARALINNPEILLMDEPFGALDALTREKVQDLTRNIWHETGKTIFFITHDVEEALLLGTRIIVLSRHPGQVIEDIQVNFSSQIVKNGNSEIKFSPEFYKYREKLLKLINAQ